MIQHLKSNPFLSQKLGNGDYSKYSSLHFERMITGIPETEMLIYGIPVKNIFDSMISGTRTKIDDFKLSIAEQSTESSQREGKTISLDDSITDMKTFISYKEGVIADKFHPGTPVYEEFYPHGKSEYRRAAKKDIETVFKRFIETLTRHKDSFDEAMLIEANEKYIACLTARETQLESKGKVKHGSTDIDRKRYALGVQMYKNLLTLLLINAEEPLKALAYFDESMIKKDSNDKESPALPVK